MTTNPAEDVVVRNAEPADIEAIIELVRHDEFSREQRPKALHKLFTYDWTPDKPNLDWVLTHGGVSLYSHLFAKVVLSFGDIMLTVFSASRVAGRLVESFGFERINNRKLIFRPGANLGTLFSGRARILADPEQILPLLDQDHRVILRDHLPYPCGHYLVLEDGRYSYVLTRRYRIHRSILLGDWPVERIRKGYFRGNDVLNMRDPAMPFQGPCLCLAEK